MGNASQLCVISVTGAVACLGQQWLTCHTEDTHPLDLLPCLTDHVFFVCLSGYEGDPEKLQFRPEVQFALLLRVCCRWHQRGEGEMGVWLLELVSLRPLGSPGTRGLLWAQRAGNSPSFQLHVRAWWLWRVAEGFFISLCDVGTVSICYRNPMSMCPIL